MMAKSNSSKITSIWIAVLILFICVAATTVASANIMNNFLPDDSGAILLIPDADAETENKANYDMETERGEQTADIANDPATQAPPQTEADSVDTAPPKNPGFEAVDDQTVWSTNTHVEIFKISYENGEQVITVNSDNKDKVIAPGTESSYSFKLKNTGNVALDYTVEVDAYFTPSDVVIPVTGRISRYDGEWLAGGRDEYASVSVLDSAKDSDILGAGNYTYYTLDWVWPFESGDDEYDTLLGNMATEQELTFTIVIKTIATESDDPDAGSGIKPPKTGDMASILWGAMTIGSFAAIAITLILMAREKRRNDEAEAENT